MNALPKGLGLRPLLIPGSTDSAVLVRDLSLGNYDFAGVFTVADLGPSGRVKFQIAVVTGLEVEPEELVFGTNYTLSVSSVEGGSTDLDGLNTYPEGLPVNVTATAQNGYLFDSWSGDVSGTSNPLQVIMDADKSITANFSQDESDTDGDGLTAYEEVVVHGTNPEKSDTNDDGFSDGAVVARGIDPSWDLSQVLDEVKSNVATYDLATTADVESARTIVNVSSRVTLGSGEVVTPGFVILGTSKKLLIRAVGPKLGDLGVGNPLPNPRMTVFRTRYDGNPPDVVATIDDWKVDNPESEIPVIISATESAGAFPLEPTETFQGRPFMTDDTSSAATLVTLDIGVYTVQVNSADDGVGDVLVEVYEITD